jgi:hypothetical protein
MAATVLSALMQTKQPRNAAWDDRLARLAARISVNRVIAGMHFPVDLAAGLVLGLAVGRYFVALAKGEEAKLTTFKFDAEEYKDMEFPWADFPFPTILSITDHLPLFKAITPVTELTLKPTVAMPTEGEKDRSPVRWLWGEAVKEWEA